MLCNAFSVCALIYTYHNNDVLEVEQKPWQDDAITTIRLSLAGEHYDAVICTSQHAQTESKSATTLEPTTPGSACKTVTIKSAQNLHSHDKTLSPECVRPFPRAPPRKTRSANNKRRKCAILTDSPAKAAIEQHTMKQKKSGRPKAKQPIKQAKRRSSARNNKKRKQKDTKMDLLSDDDSSETYCLFCVAAYSDSRPNEKWIQCTAFKEWAHEKCINILHSGSFICRNCDSDDSDFVY